MFGKKTKKEPYNRELQKPVLHTSICTGEQTAGFRDLRTGKFIDIMLIRDNSDLEAFMEKYDVKISDIIKEY